MHALDMVQQIGVIFPLGNSSQFPAHRNRTETCSRAIVLQSSTLLFAVELNGHTTDDTVTLVA